MRRYRVLRFAYDARPNLFRVDINEDWVPDVEASHLRARAAVREQLIAEFGEFDIDRKLQDFVEVGEDPISVVGYHTELFHQCRSTFIAGQYYPALTGACALGERILNHMVLELRESFKKARGYRTAKKHDSFRHWPSAIDILHGWHVWAPGVRDKYLRFAEIRHAAIHFDPTLGERLREDALTALVLLGDIIRAQFGLLTDAPWFIPEIVAARYIKKDSERLPFVQKFFLPNCALVGPEHTLTLENGTFNVIDPGPYEKREVSDAEFVRLLESAKTNQSRSS